MGLRGTSYSFSPQAFTAGTINAGTVNATTLNGAVSAAQLPVFGASGSGHGQGAVPDPGSTAGTARYLREDGTWDVPAGSGAATAALPAGATADYDFLEGSGSVLLDKSGNGNNGTLAAGALSPTWTRAGLAFSGQDGVSLPAALNGTQTFIFGIYINPVTSGNQPTNLFPVLLSGTTGGNGFNFLYATTGGAAGFVPDSYSLNFYAVNATPTSAPDLLSGFHVVAAVLGTGGSSVDHLYIDGVEVASYGAQGASAGLQTTGNFYLGSSDVSPWNNSGFKGTYYRAMFYPVQLSAADVQTVSAVMHNQIAARGVAVSPAPVSLAAPQLHAIGDSITAGLGVATPWPSLLTLAGQPSYKQTNWAISGITLEALNGSEPNRVALRCAPSFGPAVAMVFTGTNDFGTIRGATGTTVMSSLAGEIRILKQAGCVVFVGTMLSRGGTDANGTAFDADKDAYDALMLGQARAAGAAGVIDFAANPLLGADGASANATYFQADQIHPTAAGQTLLAAAASNALNYYFGYNETNPHGVTTLPYSMAAGDGEVNLTGVTGAGTLTLPDCTGQSGAVYRINNPQSTYAVTLAALNGSQPINGLSTVTVPSNATVTLRDVPNAKTASGCHWEM